MSDAHIPVMLREVVHALAPVDGGLYVDCTFGAGGYTRAILGEADCKVIGFDRDGEVLSHAAPMQKAFGDRLVLKHSRFSQLENVLVDDEVEAVDGIVLDLGVSSIQLDTPERGFSFRNDGPLDMRMGGTGEDGTLSAADVVNKAARDHLQSIFSVYGEERRARTIAQAIVTDRVETPFSTTRQLASLIERLLGPARKGEIHPATRVFQALRIYVNKELDELVHALFAAERMLKPGGHLVVVSFHSLEDRIVKTFFQTRCGLGGGGSRHAPPTPESEREPSFHVLFKGAHGPSDEEVDANPRARSAKMRGGERTTAPVWPEDWFRYGLIMEGNA